MLTEEDKRVLETVLDLLESISLYGEYGDYEEDRLDAIADLQQLLRPTNDLGTV